MRRLSCIGIALGCVFAAGGLAAGCGSDDDNAARLLDGGGGVGGFPLNDGALPGSTVLGAPCQSDSDCPGAGLFCLTSDSDALAGGGPANGMCVADCTEDGPTTCQGIDTTAVCLIVAGSATPRDTRDDVAYCVPSCIVGDESDLSSKCLGRVDLSCFTGSVPPDGYCWPTCGSDLDCDSGRVCNLGTGVCVDPESITGTLPIGAACERSSECQGTCLGLSEDFAFCSGRCSIGAGGCGEEPGSSEPLDAACLLTEDVANGGIGDAGYCLPLCDCNDDCLHPDAVCEAGGPSFLAATGRMGACFVAELGGDAGRSPGIPCSSGGQDAGGGGGTGGTAATDAGGAGAGGTGGAGGNVGTLDASTTSDGAAPLLDAGGD